MPGSNNNGNNGGSSKSPGSARLDLEVGGRLSVPMWSGSASADHSPTSPGFHRRRKLSTASKVSTFFLIQLSMNDAYVFHSIYLQGRGDDEA